MGCVCCFFFFQAKDGIRYLVRSRGLGDVYKRQLLGPAVGVQIPPSAATAALEPRSVNDRRVEVLALSLIHI